MGSLEEQREQRLTEVGVTGALARGDVDESFRLVLETGCSPFSVSSVQMRAMLKMRKGAHAEADSLIHQSLMMREDGIGWKMRGDSYFLQQKFQDAESCYLKAMKFMGHQSEIHHDLGVAILSQGRVQECLQHFQRAIDIQPERSEYHHHFAIMLVLAGQDAAGWDRMQSRLNVPGVCGTFPYPDKYWRGEDLTGKTIVLRSEQGWGDTIMFARYLPWLSARAKKVYFYCQRQMIGFVEHYYPDVVAWPNDAPVPLDFDYHLSLMCLPRLIPEAVPAPRKRDGKGEGIGVCWFGSPTHKADALRTVPVEMFEQLSVAAKQKLYSLGWGFFFVNNQAGVPVGHNKPPFIEYLITETRDWLETAKIVEKLDLVVTVDTAIAHLAGFLGVETWLLLPYVPDFRWGITGETTKWYPSMKLYRQTKLLEWKPVFDRVAEDLRARYP